MAPDPDGEGYWLVAADGGIFAYSAPFAGSVPGALPGVRLNEPIVAGVPYGSAYLLIGADGGVFAFGDRPFAGSLASAPPEVPIIAVLPVPVASAGAEP